ncbi:MAG TPA: hypothetical protein VMD98_07435, partial [Bryocella sp.]|nr:hypothetical protein [Bryocella sp.]
MISIGFAPADTGPRNTTFSFSQNPGGGCAPFPIDDYAFYGAGFNLFPSASAPSTNNSLLNIPIELPSPQPTATPDLSAGYSYVTFDSANASVNWTATLKYQASGRIPSPAAQPSPAPTPFSTGSNDATFTLVFGTSIPTALPTPNASFSVAGGKMSVTAKYTDPVNQSITTDFTIFMTGL